MALDKAVDSAQLNAALTSIANAVRAKGGTSAPLAFPADFVGAINAISGGRDFTLLASGSYTRTGGAGNITIPVSYTGTPRFSVIMVDEPLPATNQCVYAARYDVTSADPAEMLHDMTMGYRLNSSDVQASVGLGTGVVTVSATQLYAGQFNTTYKWQANTYSWYIYG